MLKEICIKNLYGIYSYNFNLEARGKVNVITGPNGFGKTTLLKIIYHLQRCDYWYFFLIPFEEITIVFEEITIVTESTSTATQHSKKKTIIIRSVFDRKEDLELDTEEAQYRTIVFRMASETSDNMDEFKVDSAYFRRLEQQYRTNKTYPFGENTIEDTETLLEREYDISDDKAINDSQTIRMFLRGEMFCTYVDQQRVLYPVSDVYSENSFAYTIDRIAEEIKSKYDFYRRQYSSKAQRVDSDFIHRLVNSETKALTPEEYESRLSGIVNRMREYGKYNLGIQLQIESDYPEEHRKALTLCLGDMETKLNVYKELYDKLHLFTEILTGKEFSYKSISFSDIDGIEIKDINNKKIPLHKLSSGEQNLIIIYYNLIFYIRKGGIILIDEPENSLHVEWLHSMLEDYVKMAELLDCQILVATHSPAFIGKHWNVVTDLFSIKMQNENTPSLA